MQFLAFAPGLTGFKIDFDELSQLFSGTSACGFSISIFSREHTREVYWRASPASATHCDNSVSAQVVVLALQVKDQPIGLAGC